MYQTMGRRRDNMASSQHRDFADDIMMISGKVGTVLRRGNAYSAYLFFLPRWGATESQRAVGAWFWAGLALDRRWVADSLETLP
jgi:hypothetical protein